MHTFVLHHASHRDFGRHDRLIGELAGVVGMTQSFADYRRDHRVHHAALTSESDPDQRNLGRLGIVPGLPRREYPRRLLWALMSPHLHFSTVAERARHNLSFVRRPVRTACFTGLHAILLAAAVWSSLRFARPGPLIAWGVSWLLPLTVGHHISMVLYAVGLHAWYKLSDEPGWAGYAEKTGARFFADPTPGASPWRRPALFGCWCRWWLRLVFWHLFIARFLVIGLTDNGCHDAHHAAPAGRQFDWSNAAYSRVVMLDRLPLARTHFWHTWTLGGAISQNFDRMAARQSKERG